VVAWQRALMRPLSWPSQPSPHRITNLDRDTNAEIDKPAARAMTADRMYFIPAPGHAFPNGHLCLENRCGGVFQEKLMDHGATISSSWDLYRSVNG
jgi:hypothetical protein